MYHEVRTTHWLCLGIRIVWANCASAPGSFGHGSGSGFCVCRSKGGVPVTHALTHEKPPSNLLAPQGASHTHRLSFVMSQLEQLRKLTTVVADSGDFNSYSALKGLIQDGTTNPSVRHRFTPSLRICSCFSLHNRCSNRFCTD